MRLRNWSDPRVVAIAENTEATYPVSAPFRPSSIYPEFVDKVPCGDESNAVYPLVRQLFMVLGFDADNADTPQWNPLGTVIEPGNKVLIKPNLVRHLHLRNGPYEAVVTHASLVRSILDYAALALNGHGEIVVGDAPVQSADFGKILERTGLKMVCEDVSKAWNIPIRLVDFRLWAREADENQCIVKGKTLAGDASGYQAVDLGKHSLLAQLGDGFERFRVTSYDCREMIRHHNLEVNEYLVPQTVLDADVVINLPKLKTHRKVGLTAALKNLVGINGHKDWLPHHRCGSVVEGGDEYLHKSRLKEITSNLECKMAVPTGRTKQLSRLGVRVARRLSIINCKDPYEEGSWYGNDTLWRTVLDLNRVLIYADRVGKIVDTPQRRCFTVVDGIIAGEGEGPMEPDSRHCGILVGGANSVAVDTVLAKIIGFDFRKIPIIANGYNVERWPLVAFSPQDIVINSCSLRWRQLFSVPPAQPFNFAPPSGWVGHIESKN